ncbi:MAG: acylphosphatase [Candidatus Caldarchaeales archaeon]
MKAVKIKVVGRILRTGYRWYVVDLARDLNLTGYIEFTPDGYFSIYAQGEDDNIEIFLSKLKNPPPPTEVRELSVEDAKPDSKIKAFIVRYGSIGDEIHEGFGPIQIILEKSLKSMEERIEELKILIDRINERLVDLYESKKG